MFQNVSACSLPPKTKKLMLLSSCKTVPSDQSSCNRWNYLLYFFKTILFWSLQGLTFLIQYKITKDTLKRTLTEVKMTDHFWSLEIEKLTDNRLTGRETASPMWHLMAQEACKMGQLCLLNLSAQMLTNSHNQISEKNLHWNLAI